MFRYMKDLALVIALVALAGGCTDRGPNNPNRPTSEGQTMEDLDHDFFHELILQIGRNASITDGPRVPLQIKMYAPEGSIPWIQGGQVRPVPLLVLLPPQDGRAYYFFDHGLKQLANELIAEGAIKPMAIVCIENDPIFGGYFYAGHSAPAGNYDTLIGGTLLEHLYNSTGGILNDSLPVGIGGVGMGGYGAFRAALMHNGVFRSISTTDGPLDFDGPSGNGGFVELFDDALMEQGLQGGTTERPTIDSTWTCDSIAFDTLWFRCDSLAFDTAGWQCDSLNYDSLWQCDSLEFDTAEWVCDSMEDTVCVDSTPVIDTLCVESTLVAVDTVCVESTLVVDTFCAKWVPVISDTVCVESTLVADTVYPLSWRAEFDTSGAWLLSRLFVGGALAFSPHDTLIDVTGIFHVTDTLRGRYNISIPGSQRFTITDTMTLITGIVKQDQLNFDFHLPFDSNSAVYPLIWNMWLQNNLEWILADKAGFLDNVRIWIGTSQEYDFGNYRQQTLSWIETLRATLADPSQVQVEDYSGYPGNPATNDQYIYDLMREVLIFHSKAFEEE